MGKRLLFVAVMACGLCLAGFSALAQSPQANSGEAGLPARAVKVWTNDNILLLRSPSDVYLLEKKQKELEEAAKQAAAAEAAARQDESAPSVAVPEVKTVREADDMIAQRQSVLKSQQDFIDQTNQQLANAADESMKSRLNARIETHAKAVTLLQAEITKLQAARDELAKKSSSKSESTSEKPPSSHP